MHSCLEVQDIILRIVSLGDVWALAPMRGVCRRWRAFLQDTQLCDESPQRLVTLLRTNACKRACWPVGTRSDLCHVTALPIAAFKRLNAKRHTVHPYYSSDDVLRRTIRHTGGLWMLLARHHKRRRGIRLDPVIFDVSTSRQEAIDTVAKLIGSHGYDKRLQRRILELMRYAP